MNKNEEKTKNIKNRNKKHKKKRGRKKKKEGPKVYLPRRAQKLFFYTRTVKRNPNEIETQKNQILSTQQKKKKFEKMKENKRK